MCPTLLTKGKCKLSEDSKCPYAHEKAQTKLCPTMIEKGKCKNAKKTKCPYAHKHVDLDLLPLETKIKNLNGVIQS